MILNFAATARYRLALIKGRYRCRFVNSELDLENLLWLKFFENLYCFCYFTRRIND